MKGLLFLSAAAAASVAATLNAQVKTREPDSLRSKVFYRVDSAMAKRAALGLELRATGTLRDTLGVFVEAVTPKGPAETAGIIEGDRIAAINGVDLRTTGADIDDSYTNGLASHRLSREVQKLTPGSRVTLRIYSAGRFRDVQVTAGKASDLMRLSGRFNFRTPGPGGMMEYNGHGGAMMFGPDMPMFREKIEPLLRERLNNLPNKIQLRSPMRFKTMSPARVRTFRVDSGDEGEAPPARRAQILSRDGEVIDVGDPSDYEDGMMIDIGDEPFYIEDEVEQVPPEVIRDLAATAIRDAQSALKQLVADGVV